jgi:hypothetical protein
MPTDIYFAPENMSVRVDEDPNQVFDAFTAAQGLPFRLSAFGGRGDVYVNPATVAFWRALVLPPEMKPPTNPPPPRTK